MKILSNPRKLKAKTPIYIYGAGGGGRIVNQALATADKPRPTAFIDRVPHAEKDGLPVLSAAAFLATGDRDATVVIASQHWEEISLELSAAGFREVWSAHPIIAVHTRGGEATLSSLERHRRRMRLVGFAAMAGLLVLITLVLRAFGP